MNSDRRSFFLSAAAFLGLLLVFFFPVVFAGKVLAPLDILDHLMRPWSDGAGGFGVHNAMVYDAISQYLPYDWAVCQSLQQDGFIGWNTYVYGGYALLENTMLCPGDWHHQLYRFFDFWTAWDLGIVLQFALAGIGMLVLLRGEGVSARASLVGAVAFAFYSQHAVWIYHRWVLGASCWFPWIVWAVRRARRADRVFDPWSVVFAALAFRGGSLQTCLFVVLLVGCLTAAEVWEKRHALRRRTAFRALAFYATLAAGSTILCADVLAATVPPCLAGARELHETTWSECLKSLAHWGTLLVPSAFGSPETMDLGKAMGGDMLCTKFAGTAAFVLAAFAFFRKRAPFAAKLCMAASFAVAATPLAKWFYTRSTVVFALGCAWLAAWAADNAAETVPPRAWRWIARLAAAAVAAWTAAGAAVAALSPRLLPVLHRMVERSMRPDRAARHDWLLARADAFAERFPPWTADHALPLAFAAIGLLAAWRLSRAPEARRRVRAAWSCTLALAVFAELTVWDRTWISFSDRPDAGGHSLYPVPPWANALQAEMADGGLLWLHDRASDFDYFQLNANVGLGIPAFEGYETIRPATMADPDDAGGYVPDAFAERGVSHVLVRPGTEPPPGLSNWIERIDAPDLRLYRNPSFDSRWRARQADGSAVPLRDLDVSPNHHRFDLPAGTVAVSLAEPFHAGWRDRPPDGVSASASRRPDGGTLVSFDRPLAAPATLVRSFDPRPFFRTEHESK